MFFFVGNQDLACAKLRDVGNTLYFEVRRYSFHLYYADVKATTFLNCCHVQFGLTDRLLAYSSHKMKPCWNHKQFQTISFKYDLSVYIFIIIGNTS